MTVDDMPYITVPCGKCEACLQRVKMSWANRLIEHGRKITNKFFCDLTYDELSLPLLNIESNDVKPASYYLDFSYSRCYSDLVDSLDRKVYIPSLWKQEVVKFIKRLRKSFPWKFSYWLCGEYGSERNRPHYHFLFFVDCPAGIILGHDDIYAFIAGAWQRGYTSVFPVSDKDIRYTCKYSLKQTMPDDFPAQKPFMLCSKGIGRNYAESSAAKSFHADSVDRMYYPLDNGCKSLMPRYWRERLFSDATRKEFARKTAEKDIHYCSSITEYRRLHPIELQRLIAQAKIEYEQGVYQAKLIRKRLHEQEIPKKFYVKLI